MLERHRLPSFHHVSLTRLAVSPMMSSMTATGCYLPLREPSKDTDILQTPRAPDLARCSTLEDWYDIVTTGSFLSTCCETCITMLSQGAASITFSAVKEQVSKGQVCWTTQTLAHLYSCMTAPHCHKCLRLSHVHQVTSLMRPQLISMSDDTLDERLVATIARTMQALVIRTLVEQMASGTGSCPIGSQRFSWTARACTCADKPSTLVSDIDCLHQSEHLARRGEFTLFVQQDNAQ